MFSYVVKDRFFATDANVNAIDIVRTCGEVYKALTISAGFF